MKFFNFLVLSSGLQRKADMKKVREICNPNRIKGDVVEIMADVEHDRWAGWQKYFFSKCLLKPQSQVGGMDDRYIYFALPKDLYERWTRQIETPYSELSEEEKDSDRKEARKTIEALEKEGFEIK